VPEKPAFLEPTKPGSANKTSVSRTTECVPAAWKVRRAQPENATENALCGFVAGIEGFQEHWLCSPCFVNGHSPNDHKKHFEDTAAVSWLMKPINGDDAPWRNSRTWPHKALVFVCSHDTTTEQIEDHLATTAHATMIETELKQHKKDKDNRHKPFELPTPVLWSDDQCEIITSWDMVLTPANVVIVVQRERLVKNSDVSTASACFKAEQVNACDCFHEGTLKLEWMQEFKLIPDNCRGANRLRLEDHIRNSASMPVPAKQSTSEKFHRELAPQCNADSSKQVPTVSPMQLTPPANKLKKPTAKHTGASLAETMEKRSDWHKCSSQQQTS
jgi:hypothetical protein